VVDALGPDDLMEDWDIANRMCTYAIECAALSVAGRGG
jgi:hypothetical protein